MISTSSAARSTPASRTPPPSRYSTSLLRAAASTSCVFAAEALADLRQQRPDAPLDHSELVGDELHCLAFELLAEQTEHLVV